jgi:hypothetical protein
MPGRIQQQRGFEMLAKGVFCLLAGAAIIASMWFNAMFGFSIGQHTDLIGGAHHGYVYAALFVILDAIKVSVPIMLAAIVLSQFSRVWKAVSVLIGVVLFAGATSISLAGIFGTVAVDRDNFTATRSADGSQYREKANEARDLRQKIAGASSTNPDRIASEIAAYKVQPDSRWGPTNGCAPDSVTITKSQMWCKEYHRLQAQLAEAKEYQANKVRLRELETALAGLAGAVEGDPQARRLGDKIGIGPDEFVSSFLTLLALLVEFSGGLFPLMIYLYSRAKEPMPDIGSDPDPEPGNAISIDDVRRMIDDAHHKRLRSPEPDCPVETAIERHRGRKEISYPELSDTIANVCQERGEAPLSARAIGLRVRELGYEVWQEPTDSGKVTVYGLGGARTELAEAA